MFSAAVLLAFSLQAASPQDARPPNVVLIVADDLGWTDLGCQGSGYYETPNIDRLAAQGARFTQAYAACAVCSPSRAALLTGRYPARLGVTDWIHHDGPEARESQARGENIEGFDLPRGRRMLTPRNKNWLEEEEVTLAELLKGRGYATCHIGKWHLGGVGHGPRSQGFDENHGGFQVGQPPTYFDPYTSARWPDGLVGLPPREEGEYLTDREADEAVGFIERNRERPFFLYLAHYAVHAPIQARSELIEKYAAKKPTNHDFPDYAAMVESVDEAVGRVVHALQENGLFDQTLIIFTSDNGGAVHFRATDNAPLRKGKGYAYEGGSRVPLIVHWPGEVAAGTESSIAVSGIDVFPTVAAAVGSKRGERVVDGHDLGPLLRGESTWERDTLTWHFPHYWWGTRIQPYSVILQGGWKLIYRYESGATELFDLRSDSGEQNDRAAEEPQRTRAMVDSLNAELAALDARLPEPNPQVERL